MSVREQQTQAGRSRLAGSVEQVEWAQGALARQALSECQGVGSSRLVQPQQARKNAHKGWPAEEICRALALVVASQAGISRDASPEARAGQAAAQGRWRS